MSDTAVKPATKRLAGTQWESAKAMWRSGDYTLNDLSERFGISVNGLYKRFRRENVSKGADADAIAQAASEAVKQTVVANADELVTQAIEIKAEALRASRAITKRLMYEMATATKNKQAMSTILYDIKALKEASVVVANNYKTATAILGLDNMGKDDADDLPDLFVGTMTDEDIAAIRQAQRDEEQAYLSGDLTIDDQ